MKAGDRVASNTGLSGVVIHVHDDAVWCRWDTDRGLRMREPADYVWHVKNLSVVEDVNRHG